MNTLKKSTLLCAYAGLALTLGSASASGASPSMLKDIGEASCVSCPVSNKGTIYFPLLSETKSDDGTVSPSAALWKSDGTKDGTKQVVSFGAGTGITSIECVKGVLLIGLNSTTISSDGASATGELLYASNGTEKGTAKLKDFGTGSTIDFLTMVKGTAYFSVTTTKTDTNGLAASSSSLWKTDGTVKGTASVYDFGSNKTISGMRENKGVLYLTVKTIASNEDGSEVVTWSLWKY